MGEKISPKEDGQPDTEPKTPPTYEQLQAQERNKTEALKWEREARRRAEESLTNVNKLIDDLRTARQQRQAPQPEQEPVKLPDVNEDPIGHFQAKVAMLEQALQHTYQGANQTAAADPGTSSRSSNSGTTCKRPRPRIARPRRP